MNTLKPDGAIQAGVNPSRLHAEENAPRGNPERLMSRSDLVAIAENPSKWVRSKDQQDPTSAMRLGSVLDCLVTMPNELESMFAIEPEVYPTEGKKGEELEKPWNYNAKYCRAWRESVRASCKVEMSQKDFDRANQMGSRLRLDADIDELIRCSRAQVSVPVRYEDRATGIAVRLRCIIDLVPDPTHARYGDCLADIKTAADASARGWERAIADRSYHVQAAFYRDAINAHGFGYRQFLHPVVESEAPHVVARRMMSDDWMANGQIEYERALQLYCQCLKENFWPGYDDREDDMMRPIVNGWRVAQMPAYLIKEAA